MFPLAWRSLSISRWLPRITSVIVLVLGSLAFFGWLTNNQTIKSTFLNMSPASAFVFMLIALTGLLLSLRKGLLAARILLGLTLLISVLRLAEVIFRINAGVDHLFFLTAFGDQPKLMAPNTALALILMAFALLPDEITSLRRIILGQTCALIALSLASVALAGHIYNLSSLYTILDYPPMSLSTACLLLLLSLGALSVKPDRGLTAVLVSRTNGGAMMRRLLPLAIFVPIILSGLEVLIGRSGAFTDESDVVVFTTLTVTVMVIIIWWNARVIDQTESARKEVEDALRASEARYRILFDSSSDAIIVINGQGQYIDANMRMAQLTGYSHDELVRLKVGDLAPPERADTIRADVEAIAEKSEISFSEGVILRKDGSEVLVDRSGVPVGMGVWQYVFRDITERKQAEAALRASEARYRILFEYSSDAILIINEQGRYVDANPEAERLTGYSHDEILNLKVGDMTPRQQADVAPARLDAARSVGSWSGEGVLVRKDGSELIVEIAGVKVAPELYQTIVHNIDERKRAEAALRASEARYRALFENSGDAILILDEQGHYLDANPQAERLTGYSRDEILTKALGAFAVQTSDPQTIFMEIKSRGQLVRDYTLVRKDGTEVAVEFAANAVGAGVYQSIFHDISARKQIEENLRHSLEQERELNELKSRFVSMISHDFRTPLTIIQSSSDLLLDYADRMDAEKRRDRLEKIQLQVARLIQMLNDILIIGKAERVGLEFKSERLDVREFCVRLVEELQLASPDHRIVFNSSGNCANVAVDPNLLRQAITNLLSNAVKYSSANEPVRVDLACGEMEIVLRVEDHGIGIPEADQEHLFELFHRARNVGDISGTGLGLPIVKQAVEAHGGTISVESQENVGTTFVIHLPQKSA